MGYFVAAYAVLSLSGCHRIFDYQNTPAADSAVTVVDGSRWDVQGVDRSPDAISVSLVPLASTDLPIGQSATFEARAVPPAKPKQYELTALPCLLRIKEGSAPPIKRLFVNAQANAGIAKLAIFAPPDAKPGATCAVTSPDPALVFKNKLSFTVLPPTYFTVDMGDHHAQAIKGLTLATVGTFVADSSRLVRALTFSEGGKWIAATALRPSVLQSKSTVRLFEFTTQTRGQLQPWLNLDGDKKNPATVADMIWSPIGPCGVKALYIVTSIWDPKLFGGPTTDKPGGVYCISSNRTIVQLYDNTGEALDVDPTGDFDSIGALFVTRGVGFRVYPKITPFAHPAMKTHAHAMRFVRGGAHMGKMIAIGPELGAPLLRLTKTQSEELFRLSSPGKTSSIKAIGLSYGGTFGDLVVVPRLESYGYYSLVAYFLRGGVTWQIDLVRSLRGGQKVAFDREGHLMAVITTGDTAGRGLKTAHVFKFSF